MKDEFKNDADFSSLDEILSEIDSLMKNRTVVSEDELVSSSEPSRKGHRFSDGDESADAQEQAEHRADTETQDSASGAGSSDYASDAESGVNAEETDTGEVDGIDREPVSGEVRGGASADGEAEEVFTRTASKFRYIPAGQSAEGVRPSECSVSAVALGDSSEAGESVSVSEGKGRQGAASDGSSNEFYGTGFDLDSLFTEKENNAEAACVPSGGTAPEAGESGGHELFFSLGSRPSSRQRGFATDEYEPEEYGLSDDRDLSFLSKGIRQIRRVKPSDAEDAETSDAELEYTSSSNREDVARVLQRSARFDRIRAWFTLPFALLLVYMGLSDVLPLPMLHMPPLVFCLTGLGFLAVTTGINCVPLARAVRDIFTAKANPDCALPLAGLASFALLITDAVAPSDVGHLPLFAASFALAVFFSDIWRAMKTSAVLRTFTVVGSNRQKSVLAPIDDERLSRDIMGHIMSGGSTVFKPVRTDFTTDFIKNSFAPDIGSHTSLVLAFISVPLAAAAALLSLYVGGSAVSEAVCAACCVFMAFCTMCSGMVWALPYSRASKKTVSVSSAVVGYSAAAGMNSVGAVVIDSNYLFPKGSISLDAMRTFGSLRIDDAIIDAASVVCAAGGALSRLFLGVIDNDRRLLRHVDSLLYEDGMGLSAWVNDRRVLVGTAALLRGHGVSVPSRDYETRCAGNGQDLVYVSVGGQLTAMFVVTYHPRQEIYDVLFELRKAGIGLVVINRDCNITPQKICNLFDFPTKLINIMVPSNEHLLGNSMEKERPAEIIYSKGLIGIGRVVISSLRLAAAVSLSNIVHVGGILLTAGLVIFLSVLGFASQFTLPELLICQGVWGLVTLAAARLRKA